MRARYTHPGTPRGEVESPPRPERQSHGAKLLDDLERAEREASRRLASEPLREGLHFLPLVFGESEAFDIPLERLEDERHGVRVVNMRRHGDQRRYLVAVPDSQVAAFAKKFREYQTNDTRAGNPKNEPLASATTSIDAGDIADYWTEVQEELPEEDETFWWEVWLSEQLAETAESNDDEEAAVWFRRIASQQDIAVSNRTVHFPDRTVVLAFASLTQWRSFPGLLARLAEFRRANLIASEFTQLSPSSQGEFIQDFLERVRFAAEDAPRVCLLDTGVNRGHPLLEQALAAKENQAYDNSWRSNDDAGHGTEMAGVALYGDLAVKLASDRRYRLSHRLEAVKVLPPSGGNEPPDYGPITVGAMAKAELQRPATSRAFCMAVTAEGDDMWWPTLWSAQIDQACAGAQDDVRRLVVLAAGNVREEVGQNYPDENYLSSVEDPGQSWNAITVGAYTNLTWIEEKGLDGYEPIAQPGALSPASRTSYCWIDSSWPYKPDVVFEGGNYAINEQGCVTSSEDLELLTTRSSPDGDALLGTVRDTSAATAQGARMAAKLMSEYPDYWPETIRGLVIHSAEWTRRMRQEFPRDRRKERLRVYGMGVPNMTRARRSASGYATMVVQETIQPFRMDGSEGKSHEMHMHDLPLPRQVLEDLGNTEVRMRVTLSYFVEPNPPRRGEVAKHQYASHGLRFSVKRPGETQTGMLKRLTRDAWSEGERERKRRDDRVVIDDRRWELGPERVAVRGSVHSDYWVGTAAELADSAQVCVYPVTGWWRFRRDPNVVEQETRYSLIVSISTDSSEIDLVQAVRAEIDIQVPIETEIEIELGS
ncbi:hypothetical protein Pla175_49560 [Pirellulimonas nuda]|uniref:Peptidase S8/S53 domain-containing protein n=1 Tax=Pirellulimonas nuda TaxID=2528009 RepID=A0A518DJ72_9BACT|nr:S8 family peptidase [Pirellulimonas nuda]QDU91527.1 hypothetical protein Pla175_49560 [Pirellulimonas nuda]